MPRGWITIDQFIVALTIPRDLPTQETTRLRRALRSRTFAIRLRKVIRDWLRRSPAFTSVSVTVSR
jgi:hypothetical protein